MRKILQTTRNSNNKTAQYILYWSFLTILVAISFGLGWLLHPSATPRSTTSTSTTCLHLNGFTYISPLLLCDTTTGINSSTLTTLQDKLTKVISDAQAAHDINTVSVYFRDLTSRNQTNINAQEQYYPASLNKVPVMMAYYKAAENNPAILTTSGSFSGTGDYNAGLEIQPTDSAHTGQTYTFNDLINLMIKDSDNNSFETLASALGDQALKEIYQELQIQYPSDHIAISDYITPYQFSLFLRTLYNSTYLTQEYSEQALRLLTDVDFKNGLVAGLPSGITVAHKFGIETQVDNTGKLVQRELHDCGIIYNQKTPYILCVMTKSSSSLAQAEKTIKDISAATYQEVEDDYK